MKGRGVQRLQSSGRGDQYVHITVTVPTRLNDKQKELIRQFDEAMGSSLEKNTKKSDSQQEKKSFFGKKK
jgi:molecular chaperone DnaJ